MASDLTPRKPASDLADAPLVARCRHGDTGAWEALVERFSRYVYAIAIRGFSLSEHDAQDIFQEVFTRTYENLDDLRDDAAIRPFIAQLTRRLAIDRLRSAARVEVSGGEVLTDGVDDEVFDRLDEAMTVREALAALPESCQEILDRFFARDQSYQTINAALELRPGTIASRISRCLARLRAQLQREETTLPRRRVSDGP